MRSSALLLSFDIYTIAELPQNKASSSHAPLHAGTILLTQVQSNNLHLFSGQLGKQGMGNEMGMGNRNENGKLYKKTTWGS